MFFADKSYLRPLAHDSEGLVETIKTLEKEKLNDSRSHQFITALNSLPPLTVKSVDYTQKQVKIGTGDVLSPESKAALYQALRSFCPWRKGPFELFGTYIDAEWQSNLKFDRFVNHLADLGNKKVCDIGCNNGYFMYRLLPYEPDLVLGIDPVVKYFLNFQLLQKYAKEETLKFELLGFEHLVYFKPFFDLVLCMGILYHHRNPVDVIKNCHAILKPGGQLLLETLGLAGEEATCLVPEKRYARMRNVWFVPTQKAVENLLSRNGFYDIRCLFNETMAEEEQRATEWAQVESFAEFLSEDKKQTVEGYPRPNRIYFSARKR